ncbi:unnamed protein product [Pseudo-nitzschia multistriata]|uniref:Uncharacterized protein n=1 Tax=Pseudo-nitzschia multistriata TaxID=183589 RepID=A0A448ZFP2_9STRA|nr:unnamed protein product [Pseudo-nitzschia multistriata]
MSMARAVFFYCMVATVYTVCLLSSDAFLQTNVANAFAFKLPKPPRIASDIINRGRSNDDGKPIAPILQDWSFNKQLTQDGTIKYSLKGTVRGHPAIPDGDVMTTAPLEGKALEIATNMLFAETKGNAKKNPTYIIKQRSSKYSKLVTTIAGTKYALLPPNIRIGDAPLLSQVKGGVVGSTDGQLSKSLPYKDQVVYLEEQIDVVRLLAEQEDEQLKELEEKQATAEITRNAGIIVTAALTGAAFFAGDDTNMVTTTTDPTVIQNTIVDPIVKPSASSTKIDNIEEIEESVEKAGEIQFAQPAKAVLPYLEERIRALEEALQEQQQQQQQNENEINKDKQQRNQDEVENDDYLKIAGGISDNVEHEEKSPVIEPTKFENERPRIETTKKVQEGNKAVSSSTKSISTAESTVTSMTTPEGESPKENSKQTHGSKNGLSSFQSSGDNKSNNKVIEEDAAPATITTNYEAEESTIIIPDEKKKIDERELGSSSKASMQMGITKMLTDVKESNQQTQGGSNIEDDSTLIWGSSTTTKDETKTSKPQDQEVEESVHVANGDNTIRMEENSAPSSDITSKIILDKDSSEESVSKSGDFGHEGDSEIAKFDTLILEKVKEEGEKNVDPNNSLDASNKERMAKELKNNNESTQKTNAESSDAGTNIDVGMTDIHVPVSENDPKSTQKQGKQQETTIDIKLEEMNQEKRLARNGIDIERSLESRTEDSPERDKIQLKRSVEGADEEFGEVIENEMKESFDEDLSENTEVVTRGERKVLTKQQTGDTTENDMLEDNKEEKEEIDSQQTMQEETRKKGLADLKEVTKQEIEYDKGSELIEDNKEEGKKLFQEETKEDLAQNEDTNIEIEASTSEEIEQEEIKNGPMFRNESTEASMDITPEERKDSLQGDMEGPVANSAIELESQDGENLKSDHIFSPVKEINKLATEMSQIRQNGSNEFEKKLLDLALAGTQVIKGEVDKSDVDIDLSDDIVSKLTSTALSIFGEDGVVMLNQISMDEMKKLSDTLSLNQLWAQLVEFCSKAKLLEDPSISELLKEYSDDDVQKIELVSAASFVAIVGGTIAISVRSKLTSEADGYYSDDYGNYWDDESQYSSSWESIESDFEGQNDYNPNTDSPFPFATSNWGDSSTTDPESWEVESHDYETEYYPSTPEKNPSAANDHQYTDVEKAQSQEMYRDQAFDQKGLDIPKLQGNDVYEKKTDSPESPSNTQRNEEGGATGTTTSRFSASSKLGDRSTNGASPFPNESSTFQKTEQGNNFPKKSTSPFGSGPKAGPSPFGSGSYTFQKNEEGNNLAKNGTSPFGNGTNSSTPPFGGAASSLPNGPATAKTGQGNTFPKKRTSPFGGGTTALPNYRQGNSFPNKAASPFGVAKSTFPKTGPKNEATRFSGGSSVSPKTEKQSESPKIEFSPFGGQSSASPVVGQETDGRPQRGDLSNWNPTDKANMNNVNDETRSSPVDETDSSDFRIKPKLPSKPQNDMYERMQMEQAKRLEEYERKQRISNGDTSMEVKKPVAKEAQETPYNVREEDERRKLAEERADIEEKRRIIAQEMAQLEKQKQETALKSLYKKGSQGEEKRSGYDVGANEEKNSQMTEEDKKEKERMKEIQRLAREQARFEIDARGLSKEEKSVLEKPRMERLQQLAREQARFEYDRRHANTRKELTNQSETKKKSVGESSVFKTSGTRSDDRTQDRIRQEFSMPSKKNGVRPRANNDSQKQVREFQVADMRSNEEKMQEQVRQYRQSSTEEETLMGTKKINQNKGSMFKSVQTASTEDVRREKSRLDQLENLAEKKGQYKTRNNIREPPNDVKKRSFYEEESGTQIIDVVAKDDTKDVDDSKITDSGNYDKEGQRNQEQVQDENYGDRKAGSRAESPHNRLDRESKNREKQSSEKYEKRKQLEAQARQRSKQQSIRNERLKVDQKVNSSSQRIIPEASNRVVVVEDRVRKDPEQQTYLQPESRLKEQKGLAKRQKEVADAIMKTDGSYKPSTESFANTSRMLKEVCGFPLSDYKGSKQFVHKKTNMGVYVGRTLSVPVRVSTPGTFVEFSINKKASEFDFGVKVVPDKGYAIDIKKSAPFTKHSGKGKTLLQDTVLVGAACAPCTLQFKFENKQSTLLEKVIISYDIKVTSPSRELLLGARRLRAESCLQAVEEDLLAMTGGTKSTTLKEEINSLQSQIDEKTKKIDSLKDEERRWVALIAKMEASKV